MSTELKIKVTKEILEQTKNCIGGDGCAVELSIKDIFSKAAVGHLSIFLKGHNVIHTEKDLIHLPDEAAKFIRVFDRTQPDDRPNLPELEFTITIPDEVIETIDIESLRPLLINHPTLQLL